VIGGEALQTTRSHGYWTFRINAGSGIEATSTTSATREGSVVLRSSLLLVSF